MEKPVVIIGAGLCGTLLAAYFGQIGLKTYVFEKRQDPRLHAAQGGRSINLALSERGIKALNIVNMGKIAEELALPMKARLIHLKTGEQIRSRYSGRSEDYINSISREGLNVALLEKADSFDSVRVFFEHKCLSVDEDQCSVSFYDESKKETIKLEAKVIFGADGAGSAVRRSMFATGTKHLMNFSQSFLRHGYKELHIAPDAAGHFQLDSDVLHIWPRGSHMIIALPNLDASFTVTCFFPFKGDNGFDELEADSNKMLQYIENEYPNVFNLMPDIKEQFQKNPVGALGTIKCFPHQFNDKVLLIGDAAHAIVPFYGQGMNCSFEDVLILKKHIDKYGKDWPKVFAAYNEERPIDSDAIADLAIDNFHEMKSKVADPLFNLKRQLERRLEEQYEDYYSKYSLVTFRSDLPYSVAMLKGRAQDDLLLKYCESHDESNWDLDAIHLRIRQEIWAND